MPSVSMSPKYEIRAVKKPSKTAMMRVLRFYKWKPDRRSHEPVYWTDPKWLLQHRMRTEEAYELQMRRVAHGVQ